MWIGGFLIIGAFTYGSILIIRDYYPIYNSLAFLDNDTLQAFGRTEDMFHDNSI